MQGDEAAHGGLGVNNRERKTLHVQQMDIYIQDLHIDTLRVKVKIFR